MAMFTEEDIKLINAGLVDSRTKGSAGHPVETHANLPMQRVYCVNCGKPHGYVTQDSSEFIAATNIIYVCDDCVFTMGPPPLPQVPNDVIEHTTGKES